MFDDSIDSSSSSPLAQATAPTPQPSQGSNDSLQDQSDAVNQNVNAPAPQNVQSPVDLPDNSPQLQNAENTTDQPQPMVRFQRTVGSTLMGIVNGLMNGAGDSPRGIRGAVTGGENPVAAAQTQSNDQSLQQSKVQFASAQAAGMVADAAIKDKQLHTMDEDHQLFVTNAGLDQLKQMQQLGLQPTLVTNNNKGGASAMQGLQQLTATHGAVPPLYTINLGDKVVGFDLNQLTQAPQILDTINQYRGMTGQSALTAQSYASLPKQVQIDQTNAALTFQAPAPNADNLSAYSNYLQTMKMAPDSPTKAANVAWLQSKVDGMQKIIDEQHSRAETQKISDYNAETPGIVKRSAQTASVENASKAQYDDKPVYAVNTQGETVMTTAAAAQQGGMTAIRPVKQTDITKDQKDIKVLSDIQIKSNNVQAAAGAMDQSSWAQAGIAAKYLAENPNTTVNTLFKSAALKNATPQTRNYVIAINSLRESSLALQKVLTGSARSNETQQQALLNTLPGVEPDANTVKQKLNAFNQNLSLLGQGLPKGTGVELQGFNQPQGGGQPQTYKVGDPVVQNGHTFTVTSVDPSGKVTGAK